MPCLPGNVQIGTAEHLCQNQPYWANSARYSSRCKSFVCARVTIALLVDVSPYEINTVQTFQTARTADETGAPPGKAQPVLRVGMDRSVIHQALLTVERRAAIGSPGIHFGGRTPTSYISIQFK